MYIDQYGGSLIGGEDSPNLAASWADQKKTEWSNSAGPSRNDPAREKDIEAPLPGGEGTAPDGQEPGPPVAYTAEEREALEGHIQQYFGSFEHVFHEPVSAGTHLDICLVSPSAARDCCTLVTIGMGAHRMNAPAERAELSIALPKDWKKVPWNRKDERWYWPVHLLKDLARLFTGGAWLSRGRVIDHQKPFASNTWLCAALLAEPVSAAPGGAVCPLPSGEAVRFYQVLPLYRNELNYSLEHSTEALLEKMAAIGFVARPDRPDAITQGILRRAEDAADDILEMDNGIWHLTTLRKKRLPVDERNAFSHMTIYLRWCMEHDLMGAAFLEDYGSVVKQVKTDPGSVDLRVFLRDRLNGQLFSMLFNRTGRAFASYYYGYTEDPPHYPSDIDTYAVSIIGQERNYSDEIQDEAYLFLPFDETYYQAMARIISRRFAGWQRQRLDETTLEPSGLALALVHYLNCECTYFPSMRDDDPISAAWSYARRDSAHEGFVPVLIRADDQALWERLVMHAGPGGGGAGDDAFDPDQAAAYRNRMLAAPLRDGRAVLKEGGGRRRAEAPEDSPGREQGNPGETPGGGNNRLTICWKDDAGMTHPLILAKIPVRNPWEIFAYLPFGGRDGCPDTPELMAAAKYWFEQYGAVPAALSHNQLEFVLPAPVPGERAAEAAAGLYAFCPHVLQQPTVWHLRWS